jgi:arsenate reductase
MSFIFICYPKCTTCARARKYLDDRGVAYTFRDIKTDRPTLDELRGFYEKSGLPLKRFWNTSGESYRALGLKDKLSAMTDGEQLALLAADGMLVRRPILVGDGFVLVGFKEPEWAAKLG